SAARAGVLSRAVGAGAAGVLFAADRPSRVLYRQNASVDGTVLRIPAAVVEQEGARWIARQLAQGLQVRLRLSLSSTLLEQARGQNVVGLVRGMDAAAETVVLGAHLDSWDLGSGAL